MSKREQWQAWCKAWLNNTAFDHNFVSLTMLRSAPKEEAMDKIIEVLENFFSNVTELLELLESNEGELTEIENTKTKQFELPNAKIHEIAKNLSRQSYDEFIKDKKFY